MDKLNKKQVKQKGTYSCPHSSVLHTQFQLRKAKINDKIRERPAADEGKPVPNRKCVLKNISKEKAKISPCKSP